MAYDIFLDPGLRTLIAAIVASDAPDDLRVPSVAAAWALNGPIAIVPAAIAASHRDGRNDGEPRDDATDLERKYADLERERQKLDDAEREKGERQDKIAAERREKAKKELKRCTEAFLAAMKRLEPDAETELADNLKAIMSVIGEDKSGAALGPADKAAPDAKAKVVGAKVEQQG